MTRIADVTDDESERERPARIERKIGGLADLLMIHVVCAWAAVVAYWFSRGVPHPNIWGDRSPAWSRSSYWARL
jgi:hypothetical protein